MKFYTQFYSGAYFYFLNREVFLEVARSINGRERAQREEGEGWDLNVMGVADFAIAPDKNSTSYVIIKNRANGLKFEGKLTHCMALVEEFIYDMKIGAR